jgi:hypothetical protein
MIKNIRGFTYFWSMYWLMEGRFFMISLIRWLDSFSARYWVPGEDKKHRLRREN